MYGIGSIIAYETATAGSVIGIVTGYDQRDSLFVYMKVTGFEDREAGYKIGETIRVNRNYCDWAKIETLPSRFV